MRLTAALHPTFGPSCDRRPSTNVAGSPSKQHICQTLSPLNIRIVILDQLYAGHRKQTPNSSDMDCVSITHSIIRTERNMKHSPTSAICTLAALPATPKKARSATDFLVLALHRALADQRSSACGEWEQRPSSLGTGSFSPPSIEPLLSGCVSYPCSRSRK